MGLPFWEMPAHLVIGGRSYPIDTDFRVGIRIRQMFWTPYYQKRQQRLIDGILQLLFFGADVGVGADVDLLCAVLWYLMDGRMSEERIIRRLTGDGTAAEAVHLSEGDAVFSYLWDMPSVYASFLSVYHIDLLTEKMHLWQFDALFAALPEETALRRMMAIRAAPIDSAEDGDARAALAAQKLSVRIPDDRMLNDSCLLPNGSSFCCSFADQKKTGKEADTARHHGWPTEDEHAEVCATDTVSSNPMVSNESYIWEV